MRRFILALLLASCGGGGGGTGTSSNPVTVPSFTAQPASALTFAYYGSVAGMIPQVADHVTAVMVPPWVEDQAPFFREAHAAGLKVIWYPKATPDLYQQAIQLDALGLLKNIIAVYPCDEPDINPCQDPVMAKATMAVFPALAGAKLAVIYSASGRYPSQEAYDWIGLADYSAGTSTIGGKLADLRARLLPHQKLMAVPGGADPWRTDPQAFLDYAMSDNRVAVIMPFTWFDSVDFKDFGKGIGSNGMAEAYRAVGRQIKQPQQS